MFLTKREAKKWGLNEDERHYFNLFQECKRLGLDMSNEAFAAQEEKYRKRFEKCREQNCYIWEVED